MSLTGPIFLGAVVVFTVAAFVVLIIQWPSLAGRRPTKIAARAGMLLVVNALVLLTAATQLNAQFLFFADWTDLRGAFGGAPTSTALNRGATASHATNRAVGGTAAKAGEALPPLPAGGVSPSGVISYTVKGPLSGMVGTIVVQLPRGYTEPVNASAMLHPAQYAAAIVMSGYFSPEFGPFYEAYPPGGRLTARYDLVALSKRKPPPVAIWLETSHADPISYNSSAAFLKAAKPPLAVDATILQHAGHRISLWQGLLPGSLNWLGANVAGFKPSP